jgi:uncharacterized repeat protein (TIGR01451 family)
MALTDIGAGVLYGPSTTGSGTGNYDSFLRIAANNDETGFNTDVAHQDDNKDGIWTHSLQVGSLDTVTIGTTEYYEIRLDLNEIQSGDSPNITLEDLEIFRSASPATDDSFAGMTKVFDLGSALSLIDTNHGSGTDDYVFYIPVSLFPDPSQYFTVYADFSGSDDGFEEFRALSSVFTPQPDIGVLKETNGTDDACGNLLTGQTVTWTYTVENNGNVPLSNVVVMDDNGTPGNTADDFAATYSSGDANNNSILDTTETWIFTATGTAGIGEYTNIATVSGDYVAGGITTTVTGTESDCYFGANPLIDIVKLTNGTDNQCPVLMVGDAVTWTYNVTNTGNVALSNVVIVDDNGTVGTGDDFNPTAVLSGLHNVGDTNLDDVFDPGETWQYTASGTAIEGHYENTATVTADFTDDFAHSTTVNDSETDCYLGLEGPCPRTPGFWAHWTDFWDGDASVPSQAGQDDFPTGDLLLQQVDSNNDGVVDARGLLIGDFDKNGIRNGTEDVIFISYANAINLINASTKQMNDGVVKIGRDVVATWLNYLMGSPIGDTSDTNSPAHFIQDAVNYLQTFGDSSSSNTYNAGEVWDTYAANHGAVKTSTGLWNNNIVGDSGAQIHSALDGYNNTGTVNGIAYAASCDNEQFLNNLHGYSLDGALFAA